MGRIVIAFMVFILSILSIGFAFTRDFAVYSEDVAEDVFAFYDEVQEPILVYDATFSGVFRSKKTGRLITTYDRSQPQGRVACPT